MLERGEQRERRKAAGGHLRAQAQEGPRRAVGERAARRIVDLEAPAPELRRHAPRQAPVGGDQRRAATRLVQRPAQDERDDARFLARPRTVDAGDALQRMGQFAGFGAVFERRPRGGRRGRPERQVGQARARRRRLAKLRVRPRHHVRARNTQALQKHRQTVLRVGGVLRNRRPGFRVGARIEARQDHHAVRQGRDDRKQLRGGRDAARRARGDHRVLGRAGAPGPSLGLE